MTKKKKPEDLVGAGRPTIMTEENVKKFIQGFKLGFNDSECCAYVEVSRQTYITYRDSHPEFLDKVNEAKEYQCLMAKHTIAKNMGKPEVAKWYLEKRRKDEFGDIKKIQLETTDKFEKMSVEEKLAALEANEGE